MPENITDNISQEELQTFDTDSIKELIWRYENWDDSLFSLDTDELNQSPAEKEIQEKLAESWDIINWLKQLLETLDNLKNSSQEKTSINPHDGEKVKNIDSNINLDILKRSLDWFTTENWEDAYSFFAEKFEINDDFDVHSLVLLLHDQILDKDWENLNLGQIEEIIAKTEAVRTTDKEWINIILDYNKVQAKELLASRTQFKWVVQVFKNNKNYFNVLKNIWVRDYDQLTDIFSNYSEYTKLLNKLKDSTKDSLIKDSDEYYALNLLSTIDPAIKRFTDLQKKYNFNIVESVKDYKWYWYEEMEKSNSETENNEEELDEHEDENNDIEQDKISDTSNNYYAPTEDSYSPVWEWKYNILWKNWEKIEWLVISEKEKNLTLWNPEATENLINFYEFFKKLNLEWVWEHRENLLLAIWDININPNDGDSIKDEELRKFWNRLLTFISNIENPWEQEKSNLTNLNSVEQKLREFSWISSWLSDSRTFNIEWEDKFTAYLRTKWIIGWAYFQTNKFRELSK